MTYKATAGLSGFDCPCGKQGFTTRVLAKRAARTKHPGLHLAVYPCGRLWHFGHLPQAALAGVKGRREVYRRG